jgi:hypothetical protein
VPAATKTPATAQQPAAAQATAATNAPATAQQQPAAAEATAANKRSARRPPRPKLTAPSATAAKTEVPATLAQPLTKAAPRRRRANNKPPATPDATAPPEPPADELPPAALVAIALPDTPAIEPPPATPDATAPPDTPIASLITPPAPAELEVDTDPGLVALPPGTPSDEIHTDPSLVPLAPGWAALAARLRALPLRIVSWFGRRLIPPVLAGLAASIPVLTSTVRAAHEGWQPAGDDGIILTRALDVFTSHSPLIGQYSEAGDVTGEIVHSAGPMLYWLLAVPVRLGGPASAAIAMGIVNTLAIIGCVALARRRGGLVLMFATAIGIALMCQSLSAEIFHDVWNPSAAMFPFLLLLFLCWSLACGEYRLLPAVAIVASFVVQTHLTYVAPTAGVLVIGIGGLAVARLHFWLAARRKGEPRRRAHVGRWTVLAVIALAVCWSFPIADQIEHSPGNLSLIVRSANDRGTTLGAPVGWNAVVEAIEVHPWWLTDPKNVWSRKSDVRKTPSNTAIDSAIVILLGLWLIAAVAAFRRRGELVAASLMGLVLCLALGANAANTPTTPLLAGTLGYTMWWGSQLGLWVWLTIAWALWCALVWLVRRVWPLLWPLLRRAASRPSLRVPRLPRLPQLPHLPRGAAIVAVLALFIAGLAATASVGQTVASKERHDSHYLLYHPIAELAARVNAVIPPGQTINYGQGPLNTGTQPMEPAMRFRLELHGDRVLSEGALPRLGPYYVLGHRSYQWVVYILDGSAPQHGLTLVGRVHFVDRWGHETVSVWVKHEHHGRGSAP